MAGSEHSAPRRCRGWRLARRLLAIVGVGLVALLGAGQIAKARLQTRYPAPGQRIDIGGYALHIYCSGQGGPTVILESGLGSDSLTWANVQPVIAAQTRVCAYDRAGYGWSDPSPHARSAEVAVAELHTLLERAGIAPPYIMVGHSLGGVYAKLYAWRYPDQLAGLVLVDPSDERDLSGLPLPDREHYQTMVDDTATQMGGLKLLIDSGLPALWPAMLGANPKLPVAANAAATALQASDSTALQTSVDELIGLEASFAQVQAANITALGDLPLVLLLAGQSESDANAPAPAAGDLAAAEERQRQRTARLVNLSPQGQVEVVVDSGHHIQWDRPDRVVAAIAAVLAASQ
ncbi:MAG: alpha/beta hydrolase [Herpetosiphonaceae bacterium]|nr:alpha/beta hydrolase [Herpetosiphonaceae bacterium]